MYTILQLLIMSCSITDEQLKSLGDIEMKCLFKCMELFVGWLLDGLYDFSTLPISVIQAHKYQR